MTTENQIGAAFLTETAYRLKQSFRRIYHCLDQLDDQDIWWRPNDQMNSIGNLILHLNGNLSQWILHGLGGQEDVRDRPSEFDTQGTLTGSELKSLLIDLEHKIEETLKGFDPSHLLRYRRIQGFDKQLLSAAYGTMCHLEGHTGQIMYITRIRKGADYKLYWQPQTEEQESKRK